MIYRVKVHCHNNPANVHINLAPVVQRKSDVTPSLPTGQVEKLLDHGGKRTFQRSQLAGCGNS